MFYFENLTSEAINAANRKQQLIIIVGGGPEEVDIVTKELRRLDGSIEVLYQDTLPKSGGGLDYLNNPYTIELDKIALMNF